MLNTRAGFIKRATCTLTLVFAASPAYALHDYYELEIHKSERILLVKHGSKVEKKYTIAQGSGGRGDKRQAGDKKTPVGTYRIVKINNNSNFSSFLQLNYPNVKDAFYGLKERIISQAEFDRIVVALSYYEMPPQNTALGGLIGIHGLGAVTRQKVKIHDNFDWTKGCIALTNEDLADLRRYVAVGTIVVIND